MEAIFPPNIRYLINSPALIHQHREIYLILLGKLYKERKNIRNFSILRL